MPTHPEPRKGDSIDAFLFGGILKGPWVKLWRNILTDEKLKVLIEDHGDKAFRVWITLLARCEDGMVFDDRRILESITQTKGQKLEALLSDMQTLDMIRLENKQIIIVKWKEHQEGTSTHRTRAFRERQGNANETQTERVEDRSKKIEEKIEKNNIRGAKAPFVKPTFEEVSEYCKERNRGVNAEAWLAHYESNGWMVGKNHMQNWKGAVRSWEHSGFQKPKAETTEEQLRRLGKIS